MSDEVQVCKAIGSPLPGVSDEHWGIVQSILLKHASAFDVWAFGSRAKGQAKKYSDLDLAIVSEEPLSIKVIAALANDFSDSDLPYKVDILDWASTSETFRDIVQRNKVVVMTAHR